MGIRKGHYYIKGLEEPVGNVKAQKRISRLGKNDARGIVMNTYPWDKYIDWTIQDFGAGFIDRGGYRIFGPSEDNFNLAYIE